jgi:CBS domain-containing protein
MSMLVKEVMTPGVECARPADTVAYAADRMKVLDVGSLPVLSDDDELVGTVTDRDITTRATAQSSDPASTSVAEVMTPNVVWVFEDQSVEEAGRLMKSNQVRRLVVMSREKRLVGIVSLGDLALRTGGEGLGGEVLEHVSEPPH